MIYILLSQRRVYLNKYVDIKKLLIFDGTIGRIHRQFYEEKVGKNYVVKNNSTGNLAGVLDTVIM
jgi:hypothetical protein